MKRYDLHIHTKYSKCSSNEPFKIIKIAKKKGLDGIAITDHNTIKGALKVKKLNKDKDFEVVVGEEVMTDAGEVLVYYVKREIKFVFFVLIILYALAFLFFENLGKSVPFLNHAGIFYLVYICAIVLTLYFLIIVMTHKKYFLEVSEHAKKRNKIHNKRNDDR